jgi:phenylalanyl-tRNA synthetase beta chain
MNISYNWLKEYLDFDLTPDELSAALTSIGLETGGIEEVQTIKGGLEGLVVGEVLTCVDHPNSDHLHVTTVNVGQAEALQIVCGAANVAAGQKVIVALVGTTLYSGDESFTIKKSKIRGEESFGMICAEDEIGIGTSHEGIIVLPADAVPGTLAKDYYNIKSEYILEVDITPNRVDATSHFGVARDLAAYLKQNVGKAELKKPIVSNFPENETDGAFSVRIENETACPRYSGVTIRGVKIQESPEWLKNRLSLIGLHPINNVVDITNYVLHELGHPLHAFDLNKLSGNEIIAKTLPSGTKFTTLDGVERELDEKDLVICDAKGAQCLGGVFGGLDSGVSDSTTDIFLECAYFNPTYVRKTARRHVLSTDSSFRFERGCDPNDTVEVLKRAASLIIELAGGKVAGTIQDVYPQKIENAVVELTYKKVNSLIGKEIDSNTVISILNSLEVEILEETVEDLKLSIPTYRVDVTRDVDVIEDILRIYGYNNIEFGESLNSNLSYQSATDTSYDLQTLISEQLTGSGFHEVLNNSLTKEAYYLLSESYPVANNVKVINPLSTDLSVLRQTLLFGGLENVAYNRNRKNADIRFYEFGNVYRFDEAKKNEENPTAQYSEATHLGLWVSGNTISNNWAHADEKVTVYHLKAYVENVLVRLGITLSNVTYVSFKNEIFSEALGITEKNKEIGILGIVSKKVLKQAEIDSEVFFAELNWTALMKSIRKNKITYAEISKFPEVKRDFALLVDKSVAFADIERVAKKNEKKLLKSVSLFDVYEGKNLPEGKKSYAVNFVLQDEEKTLNEKQIETVMKKIQTALEGELGAQLR